MTAVRSRMTNAEHRRHSHRGLANEGGEQRGIDRDLDHDIEYACSRIAPTWPLDRFIAVNPYWGWVEEGGQPIENVSSELLALSGAMMVPSVDHFRIEWRKERLRREHLEAALNEARLRQRGKDRARTETPSIDKLIATLAHPPTQTTTTTRTILRRRSVLDVAHEERDDVERPMTAASLPMQVIHSISQHCANFFNDGQAITPLLDREQGLYGTWRAQALYDHAPRLVMGFPEYSRLVNDLPETADEMIATALSDLDVPRSEYRSYLVGRLLDVNGWAAWCAYQEWMRRHPGPGPGPTDGGAKSSSREKNRELRDLLAIRLAWEWLLIRRDGGRLRTPFQLAILTWPSADRMAREQQSEQWILQRALEIAFQASLCDKLRASIPQRRSERPQPPEAQVVFCIDVRSEVIRRSLEKVASPAIQTLGFAGFFGLPIEYVPLLTRTGAPAPYRRPQLPGLLGPSLRVTDGGLSLSAASRRRTKLEEQGLWTLGFGTSPIANLMSVEALGLFALPDILRRSWAAAATWARPFFQQKEPRRRDRLRHGRSSSISGDTDVGLTVHETAGVKPTFLDARMGADDVQEKSVLAAGILNAMSLTRGFAKLVALVGHGTETTNNAHASGLDCGACCGQNGAINAHLAASLFNDANVRLSLEKDHGIAIPKDTYFVAGLHNTTTEEVTFFLGREAGEDDDSLPESHWCAFQDLAAAIESASAEALQERARKNGVAIDDNVNDREAVRLLLLCDAKTKARNWAEVRPEWGLANNAAFIVGRRSLTKDINLDGRVFLHEYRHEEDATAHSVLELIMTAPMIVTHWINMQYYASTVDNARYGSGNKVLHNVVGGHVGVFEGNGGDLRIGLPLQCLHDGESWRHTPLRLSVFVEAPQAAITAILQKHPQVMALVKNEWLFLFQVEEDHRAEENSVMVSIFRDGEWQEAAPSALRA